MNQIKELGRFDHWLGSLLTGFGGALEIDGPDAHVSLALWFSTEAVNIPRRSLLAVSSSCSAAAGKITVAVLTRNAAIAKFMILSFASKVAPTDSAGCSLVDRNSLYNCNKPVSLSDAAAASSDHRHWVKGLTGLTAS